ncbi:MAG TPA: hypothetical protein DCF44_00930 [Chitinophagaceae bacterium]|nr:hypothetical protein [Chitinophagaceae bacterium]
MSDGFLFYFFRFLFFVLKIIGGCVAQRSIKFLMLKLCLITKSKHTNSETSTTNRIFLFLTGVEIQESQARIGTVIHLYFLQMMKMKDGTIIIYARPYGKASIFINF